MPGWDRISGRFVLPGEALAVIEEYMSGTGTYESGGTIYSLYVGTARIEPGTRKLAVIPKTRTPLIPSPNQIVLASVSQSQEKTATMQIFEISDQILGRPFTAALHISNASYSFVRDMRSVCKASDIVRAAVLNVKNRVIELTLRGRDLGVVRAFCSVCGTLLILRGNRPYCGKCQHFERRRIALGYMRS